MSGLLSVLRRRRWSLAWLALVIAVGILLAVLVSVPLLRGTDAAGGSLVGQPAPALAATDLEGTHWTLADTDGRLTWVNFWATSCGPCRAEMPAMQALAELHPDELLVLGIDWGEERTTVADFAARYGINYTILLDPALDNYYRWSATDGLPRHYFVGADGVVLREVIGPLNPADMQRILDQLLG
jgi:cytochrome c biogenesis protein CcmG, thiol:disulfide interchange protein DsbE